MDGQAAEQAEVEDATAHFRAPAWLIEKARRGELSRGDLRRADKPSGHRASADGASADGAGVDGAGVDGAGVDGDDASARGGDVSGVRAVEQAGRQDRSGAPLAEAAPPSVEVKDDYDNEPTVAMKAVSRRRLRDRAAPVVPAAGVAAARPSAPGPAPMVAATERVSNTAVTRRQARPRRGREGLLLGVCAFLTGVIIVLVAMRIVG